MQIVSALTGLAAAGAVATPDWHFVSLSYDSTMYVDLASISTSANDHRDAQVFFLMKEDNSRGVAAIRVQIEVDCAGHRKRTTHLWTINAASELLHEADVTEDWKANALNTPSADIERYICTRGASRADSPSIGSSFQVAQQRQIIGDSWPKK